MLWPVRLDQLCDTATVARDRPVLGVDLGHSLSAPSASSSQGFFGQLAEVPAPSGSAAICLDVDGPEKVVRERHHHFRHTRSIPGIATWYRRSEHRPHDR